MSDGRLKQTPVTVVDSAVHSANPAPATARSRQRAWGGAVGVLLVSALWCIGLAKHDLGQDMFSIPQDYPLSDFAYNAVLFRMFGDGALPYRDFDPRFGPLGFLLFPLALRANPDALSLRYLLAGASIAIALATYGLARRAALGRWAYIAPVSAIVWSNLEYNVPGPRPFAVLLVLGALYVLTAERGHPSWRRIVSTGTLLGCAIAMTQNTGGLGVMAAGYLLCLQAGFTRPDTDGEPRPSFLSSMVPVLGAVTLTALLAGITRRAFGDPLWFMVIAPGCSLSLALGVRAWTHPTLHARTAVRFCADCAVLAAGVVIPLILLGGAFAATSGIAPIIDSVLRNGAALAEVYYSPLDAPDVGRTVALVGSLLAIAGLLAIRIRHRSGQYVHVALLCALLLSVGWCWTHFWPGERPSTPSVTRRIVMQSYLTIQALPYLTWAICVGALAVIVGRLWTASERPWPTVIRVRLGIAVFAATAWGQLFPLSDYTHLIFVMPVAGLACAVLANAGSEYLKERWPEFAARRALIACAAAATPLSVVAAMILKWCMYFVLIPAYNPHSDRARLRAFTELDPQTCSILVDTPTAQSWQALGSYIRRSTQPGEPVLGLPFLPTANLVGNRPFALYDNWWWPTVPAALPGQYEDMTAALTARRPALVILDRSPVGATRFRWFSENWPAVIEALKREYVHDRDVAHFAVYRRREEQPHLTKHQ